MSDISASGAGAPSAPDDDQTIRQRVRELTGKVLQEGRLDTDAVMDVVRAMTGQTGPSPTGGGAETREPLADAVRRLDEALSRSGNAAHFALQQLASRGEACTDSDLKEALFALRNLDQDCSAATNRIVAGMSSNLRREMSELATRVQDLGVETSARVANVMGEFASRMGQGAASGLGTMRNASARMALFASGVLGGIADALRDQSNK